MSYRLDTHALIVDVNAIHKVDIGNLANLYSMWIERSETFVVDNEEKPAPTTRTLPQTTPSESKISDVPVLSSSVETLVDEEAVDSTSVSAPLGIDRPRMRRQDSCASTRSKRERRISSDDLEKMIVSVVQDKGLPALPQVALVSKKPLRAPPAFGRSSSTTTESQSPAKSIAASEGSSQPSPESLPHTTVVHALPEPKSSPMSNEQDQNLTDKKPIISIIKKPVFQIGGSSEEDGSLTSAVASSRPSSPLSAHEDQASFSNHVMTRTIDDEAAVDSDTDDYIDESAIDDDDDSSDWEDSMGESGKSSMDHKLFQRVDSKPNLTSRRSLITLMFAENDPARNLGNHASHSTSAILRSRTAHGLSLGASRHDSDATPLMMKGKRLPCLKPIHVPRPNAQTIMTGPQHIQPQAALSPRTTRRNMLGTELTESLRRHLLWERQVKSSTANAVLKRRHTSHGVSVANNMAIK
ncbi:hypothetical protein BFJ63_vAg18804 [Fusarium oxysporum f. sp. narcissi]|uniref:DUF3295 domain-containing protein n=1 Tax=Fusarium oxysporum f. sp. narcissi TaxID=451672 RepID=A0A4Q2UWA4_FUSOX|nr:hypothetical protein BFJ63_vAg18804 [Fusarium oxysporum f. sp. narcissi]